MRDTEAELFRALMLSASVALKPKHQRKLFAAMRDNLRTLIPHNGTGPLIGSRRDAVQILECAVRLLERDAIGP